MAGSSQSTSTTRSQSTSDTYIPEYSESPILQEIALHARAMSDVVYNWGMGVYNKNQGSIDSLMRDALSYASPQRIAVDMGMAEAGVQQAGERGRLSAIRDLESYGIDPSSGRYAQLDSANRVMTAAAAAGAGNQQRMATQAAGNAMRNQAIAASLQNAQFGSGVNRDTNAFLQTASSLKYPPLGRTSQSTSATDSQSSSQQTDPSKGGGSEKAPSKPSEKPPAAAKPSGQGQQKPQKEPPKKIEPPKKAEGEKELIPLPRPDPRKQPGEGEETPGEGQRYPGSEVFDSEQELSPGQYPGSDVFDSEQEMEPGYPGSDVFDSEQEIPQDQPSPDDPNYDPNAGIPESPSPDDPNYDPGAGTPVSEDPWGGLTPPNEEQMQPGDAPYDPYAGQTMAEQQAFDPVTGAATGDYGDEQQVAEADPAGSIYAGGDWTDATAAAYFGDEMTGADTWSDIGQGTMDEGFDSAFDDQQYADEGIPDDAYGDLGGGFEEDFGDIGDYGDFQFDEYGGEQGYDDFGDIGDDEYGDLGDDYDDPYEGFDEEDYYDDFDDYDDPYEDYTDEDWENYYDDEDYYGDEEDYYGDEEDYYGDEEDYYGDEEDYYGDEEDYYGDEEDYYGDEDEDYYGDEDEDYYGDEGDDYYDDSGGDDYYDDSDGDDYYDDSGGGDDYYDDSGGDDYDEGARGGAVMRGRIRRGKRRAHIMPPPGGRPRPRPRVRPRRRRPMRTGFRARPPMRRRRFAQGGAVPPGMPQGMPQGMPAARGRPSRPLPPKPPGAMGLAPRPQPPQAPRPARGAAMPMRGGPQPAPMGRGPLVPGQMISANGMPPPVQGGMQRPTQRPMQRMARGGMAGGGQAGRRAEPTQGGFVSRELSPSNGSTVDDVQARLNAGEFVVPKDVAAWKGKEFFYKLIAQARANRSGGGKPEKSQSGYSNGGTPPGRGMR